MKLKAAILTALIAALATTVIAQPGAADATATSTDLKPIAGIWRCDMHDLPAVTLTVSDEGGSLNGAVLFYLHKKEKGLPETATPGAPQPLFHPTFDGTILTFAVSHRRAHPPESLTDAPITFALKLNGPDKAELINESDTDPNRPRYFFTRSAN